VVFLLLNNLSLSGSLYGVALCFLFYFISKLLYLFVGFGALSVSLWFPFTFKFHHLGVYTLDISSSFSLSDVVISKFVFFSFLSVVV
jgi:hypothetical protein